MGLGMLMQQYRAGRKNTGPDAMFPVGTSDAQTQTLPIDLHSFQCSRESRAKL